MYELNIFTTTTTTTYTVCRCMKYENVPLGDTLPPGALLRAAARGEGQGDPGQCRGPDRSSGGPS